MILKLGYIENDGINVFRYLEDFTELKITSFLTRKYKYFPDLNIIVYNTQHEMKKTELMFNKNSLLELESPYEDEDGNKAEPYICVTFINFLDNKTNTYQSYACLADSVYLMNDNGKTIDKY